MEYGCRTALLLYAVLSLVAYENLRRTSLHPCRMHKAQRVILNKQREGVQAEDDNPYGKLSPDMRFLESQEVKLILRMSMLYTSQGDHPTFVLVATANYPVTKAPSANLKAVNPQEALWSKTQHRPWSLERGRGGLWRHLHITIIS